MKSILIGYDLNQPGADYAELIAKIKSIANGYWHNLDSTWIIRTDLTAIQVCNEIKVHVDGNDEILVIDVTGDTAAWLGFSDSGSEWLMKYL